VIVKKQVLVTGENLTDAQPGFEQQTNQPKVDLTMDAKGGASCATSAARTTRSAWPC
jgi:preprotein translocase subunit SecD